MSIFTVSFSHVWNQDYDNSYLLRVFWRLLDWVYKLSQSLWEIRFRPRDFSFWVKSQMKDLLGTLYANMYNGLDQGHWIFQVHSDLFAPWIRCLYISRISQFDTQFWRAAIVASAENFCGTCFGFLCARKIEDMVWDSHSFFWEFVEENSS